MALEKLLYQRLDVLQFQSQSGYVRRQQWTNPLAATSARILNAGNLDGTTISTFAGQPDFPRNVQIVASGATTSNVVINGTDIRGQSISETLALNGTTPVVGAKAFKTVTSIVKPTVGATTLSVGIGVKLGLDRNMLDQSVVDAYAAGVREATFPTVTASGTLSTASISANTITTNTAPNGSTNFSVYFATTDVTEASGTTS